MKAVINTCFGGLRVSKEIFDALGFEWDGQGFLDNEKFGYIGAYWWRHRTEPKLIQAIENVGLGRAAGPASELEIVDVPDNYDDWEIDDYDGQERIVYKTR